MARVLLDDAGWVDSMKDPWNGYAITVGWRMETALPHEGSQMRLRDADDTYLY